jgi:hypothetical protein
MAQTTRLASFGPRTQDADATWVPSVAGAGLCGGGSIRRVRVVLATEVGGGGRGGVPKRVLWARLVVVAFCISPGRVLGRLGPICAINVS